MYLNTFEELIAWIRTTYTLKFLEVTSSKVYVFLSIGKRIDYIAYLGGYRCPELKKSMPPPQLRQVEPNMSYVL